MSEMKDYCITYIPVEEKDLEKRLFGIKQKFMKLPDEAAKALEELFANSSNFQIERFTIDKEKDE